MGRKVNMPSGSSGGNGQPPRMHYPYGAPVPARKNKLSKVPRVIVGVGVAGAIGLLVVGACPHRCAGAPLSVQLEWERRQTLIDQAILDAEAEVNAETAGQATQDE